MRAMQNGPGGLPAAGTRTLTPANPGLRCTGLAARRAPVGQPAQRAAVTLQLVKQVLRLTSVALLGATAMWLPTAGFAATASPPATPDAELRTNSPAVPVVPQPGPARRSSLPQVFGKDAPASLADLKTIERHVKALTARVSPAVVAVEIGSGSGSGVVVSEDGLVLTAGHVCGAPGRNVVFSFPNGRRAKGKTLGVQHDSDTGLMKITDPGPWPHATMGELRQARAGDWVLALGHPGGFDLRRSLVVRLGRIIQLAPDALQTDCTISPGDSGGPLFDMHGRIIGIHSAISPAVEDNFHVAVTCFYDGWKQLASGRGDEGETRALGIYFGATAVDDSAGCRLTTVDEGSPAARAGLKSGDVVRRVGDQPIAGAVSFQRWLAQAEPNATVSLQVKRGEAMLSLEVTVEAARRTRRGGFSR